MHTKPVPSFGYLIRTRLQGKNFMYEFYHKGLKTIDIGCGEGDFLKYDKALIHGVDTNPRPIRRLQAEGYDAMLADAGKIPCGDEYYESARCHNVIEHLTVDEAYKMILEAGRVLKSGGFFILSSEIVTRKFWGTFGHTKPYPPGAIKKLLREKSREEFDGVGELFEFAGLFYLGDYYPNKIMYLVSAFLGYYTRLFRREYFLVLRKK